MKINKKYIRLFKSLRGRLMGCVLISLAVMLILLLFAMRMNTHVINTLGDVYQSNTELNDFSQALAETEKSMETYIVYHTFESIDSFYTARTKMEKFMDKLRKKPSSTQVLQKEFIVYELSRSFIFYSNKSINARRANNMDEVQTSYESTTNCYNLLLSEILELNRLLLQRNAKNYIESKEKIAFTTRIIFIIFIAFAFLIFFVLYFMITNLTKPLVEISDVAYRVSTRDFDVPLFNNQTDDEIGNICRAFDRMIISIREYIDTIWEQARTETALKEKEMEMQALYTDAQLRALQNQINPHFLFNTLNTGAQLSMLEGADKTCSFLEQVADFFRYNIQKQDKFVTVDQELGLVDNYVYIMKVRFGNRLEFIKDIPTCTFKELIPVMTLQPLVENCIKHGLKNEKGIVVLKIELSQKHIIISVTDNGNGMKDEIKEAVFDAVENVITKLPDAIQKLTEKSLEDESGKNGGTGLINVFLRLKMTYQENDIFDIVSGDDGKGTKFIIRIPRDV